MGCEATYVMERKSGSECNNKRQPVNRLPFFNGKQGFSAWLNFTEKKGFYPSSNTLLQIKSVEVHYLIPGFYKVIDKFLFCIGAGVDFCKSPKL